MLRKLLDYQLSLVEEGKPLHKLKPLIDAMDTFLYEAPCKTKTGPHIRDAIDIKRWMVIVVLALLPCFLFGIWNAGLQSFVYSSGDFRLMDEFILSSTSFQKYMEFASKDNRWMHIISEGLYIVLPIVFVSYAVGGLWEGFFAVVRGHEISEGFLVTGMLYALILPPTIPLWMVAVGVSLGVVFAKEVFGGSGMNIVNPALACRCFLFFGFPGRMSGNVWVGDSAQAVRDSLVKMNQTGTKGPLDGFTQATKLSQLKVSTDIKRIHVDAIASNNVGSDVGTFDTIKEYFQKWVSHTGQEANLGELTQDQLRQFVTSPLAEGGLGLSTGFYEDAYNFASVNYGLGANSNWGFFLGNKLGCIGETSVLACLIGAFILIVTRVGSWRTMAAMTLGAFITALFFQLGSTYLAEAHGAWLPAQFGIPAYKHLLLGGLAFGIVFMATDPVSSPDIRLGKWIFGFFAGAIAITIRVINPAYPEGVMLAILTANCAAPLIDYYAAKIYVNRRLARARRAV
ncbi:NADH:ubiquinone reductase (Na(+)-transporting) subunit B [Estrella lausannensis]|uniref:Na(+)-translocating NADH-quinone reductase subunit B n=1 Tax=Estrella lausannensis TaxID=483423 RepID=A0A0H5DQA5_9BACT|nr:NADH:ubiquinone reductase (Na(+)-transporting) subunit B [Estrella lausannensis]CRX37724.1 Na(+)-translocating NADH-quinone reductase subunit B [Estrella lausannensis]